MIASRPRGSAQNQASERPYGHDLQYVCRCGSWLRAGLDRATGPGPAGRRPAPGRADPLPALGPDHAAQPGPAGRPGQVTGLAGAAAFLDRDGTLIADYADADWSDKRAPEWLPGSVEAVAAISALGYTIIIVTNQYLIGEGFITQADYDSINRQVLETLRAASATEVRSYHCPHPRSWPCACAKPGRGLIDQALLDMPRLALAQSILVGDSLCDLELGQQVGIETFGIGVHSATCDSMNVGSLGDVAAILQAASVCAD